jgi:hypothetical protein
MPGRLADTDPRRRSALRVLVPPLVFGLVVVAAVATQRYYGPAGPGSLVLSGGTGLIALWALYDGARRAIGRPTYLGTGRGIDRLFGLIQAVTAVGLAVALLPNTVRLLDLAARLVTGEALQLR